MAICSYIANNLNITCMQDVYHWWISGLEGLNHVSIGWPRPLWTSPVPYTILGALKTSGPTTASSSSVVNMGLLGEVKHRNVTQKLLYAHACYSALELMCIQNCHVSYISDAKAVYTLHKHTFTVYYDHLCCVG